MIEQFVEEKKLYFHHFLVTVVHSLSEGNHFYAAAALSPISWLLGYLHKLSRPSQIFSFNP